MGAPACFLGKTHAGQVGPELFLWHATFSCAPLTMGLLAGWMTFPNPLPFYILYIYIYINIDYKTKYLKYKNKYLFLKEQIAGKGSASRDKLIAEREAKDKVIDDDMKKLISKIKDVGFIVETTPHYDDMGFLYARR